MTKKEIIKMPILPEAKFVKNGEFTNAYFTLGDKGAEPLVLCHGLAASGLQFVMDAHFFADKGYYVIVPDLRGLGRSITPKSRQISDFSLSLLTQDLLIILDEEKINSTHWVGNSLGGILALLMMGRDKERLKTFTSFGTAYSLNVPHAFIPLLQYGYDILGHNISAQLGARATSPDPNAQLIIHAMLMEADMWVVKAIGENVRHYDFIPNALAYEKPMLLIRGARDIPVNQVLKPTIEAMKNRDNFTLIDIKKAGHCANLDQPEKMRQVILEFIDANNQ
jgi:pimeloyl-ACP methyl ester carboxylesterase